MENPDKLARRKNLYVVLSMFALLTLTGCAGNKIAPDLLANTKVNSDSLVANTTTIQVDINPDINNYEKLDESVKSSLELALENANIFGTDSTKPYRISANILIASQAAWSFGNFNGKLEIAYIVVDDTGNQILEEKIYTEAGSDKMKFSGAARHRRARAVNISKNVLLFVEKLQASLEE